MATPFERLRLFQLLVFMALGLVSVGQWWRRRDEASAWLAATFGVLATAVLVGNLLPAHSQSSAVMWGRKLNIALVALFPYLLYRFMATFTRPIRWIYPTAAALTAITVSGALALPDIPQQGEPRSLVFQIYLSLFLLQWVSLSGLVAVRLWRGGRGQPTVSRRRMRTLSLGSLGLTMALVLAATTPSGEQIAAVSIVVELLAIVSGALFFVGFAPPPSVRRAWRRPEEANFRQAELGLMEAETADGVAAVLLPHVSRLIAGRGTVLVGAAGVLGSYGLTDEETQYITDWLIAHSGGGDKPFTTNLTLAVPLQSGWLAVKASVYTPFFGREEMEMLRALALVTDLALHRCELLERERQSRAQLAEAQQIARMGSWQWDLRTDQVTWSEEMYRIFDLNPGDFEPSRESLFERVHPDDRESIRSVTRDAIEQRKPFDHEYRILRPNNEIIVVQAQGSVLEEESGGTTKMIGTAQDITERKRQESFREQFIANAAHELRTPVTSLLGLTEILSHGRHHLSEEKIDAAFEAVNRAGRRLSVLVNNLLDLSKLQHGGIKLTPQPVPMESLSRKVLESVPVPAATSVEVRVDDDAIALADPDRLDQVLSNLLTNAIRYGGPQIVLESKAAEDEVVVSLSDNGPGVEEDLVPHLFDPFARGTTSAGVGGSGLGLAIVRMLVDASGGEIWYDDGRSSGAHFCIRLPRAL